MLFRRSSNFMMSCKRSHMIIIDHLFKLVLKCLRPTSVFQDTFAVSSPIPGSNRYDKYLPGEHRGGLWLCICRHLMQLPSISISSYSIHICNMSESLALGAGFPCRCMQNICKTTLVLQITYCILSHPSAQWFQPWLAMTSQTNPELLNFECSSKIVASPPQLQWNSMGEQLQ